MAKLTLRDFEKLQNKGGLVPMTILRSFAPYFQGDVAGFPPKTAFQHYEQGVARPVGIDPEPEEPTGLRGPTPARPQTRTRAAVTSRNVPTARAKPAAAKAAPDASNVRIPEDWDATTRGNTMKRIALAQRISGKTGPEIRAMGGDEAAKEIIQKEIDRRQKDA